MRISLGLNCQQEESDFSEAVVVVAAEEVFYSSRCSSWAFCLTTKTLEK